MAGLDHVPAPTTELRDPVVERHNSRLGLRLFAVYFVAYVAYVLINSFWPSLMDEVPWGGLNVAVISGLGLIGGAMVLALIYAMLCRTPGGSK
jgi:uncharacterized membrane protein (DUF485 family)